MVLAGTMAYEKAGFKTFGFHLEEDIWGPEKDVYWGKETVPLAVNRYGDPQDRSSLEAPLAASHFQLVYVNPEGVEGNQIQSEQLWMLEKLLDEWNERRGNSCVNCRWSFNRKSTW